MRRGLCPGDEIRLRALRGSVRVRLRIAAGEDEERARAGAAVMPQGGAHLAIALGGDGAGVQEDHIRALGQWGGREARLDKQRTNGVGFTLIDLAAEGLKKWSWASFRRLSPLWTENLPEI